LKKWEKRDGGFRNAKPMGSLFNYISF